VLDAIEIQKRAVAALKDSSKRGRKCYLWHHLRKTRISISSRKAVQGTGVFTDKISLSVIH